MIKLLIKESDDKITANTFQELIGKLEKHGYSCEHYYDVKKPDSKWLYITKNGDPYEAEFYKYSDGKYELYLKNIHPTNKDTYEGCGKKKKKGTRKLKEGSNFDNVTDAIDYYYGKWSYGDISYNGIEDELGRLGHSEQFIDAVLDGITQLYDDQERYDYEHDYYDEGCHRKKPRKGRKGLKKESESMMPDYTENGSWCIWYYNEADAEFGHDPGPQIVEDNLTQEYAESRAEELNVTCQPFEQYWAERERERYW